MPADIFAADMKPVDVQREISARRLHGDMKAENDSGREHGTRGLTGLMAEWLGKGLQNLVQRFESASDLFRIANN